MLLPLVNYLQNGYKLKMKLSCELHSIIRFQHQKHWCLQVVSKQLLFFLLKNWHRQQPL
jgi:hypothetical protein